MGTGYNRNVSEWSKGEYYLANNTQDDLATIAAKLGYRADDHGDTQAAATPIVVTGGTNIVSTRPDTDPTNQNQANKGVLEQSTDVDVFSFVTGTGPVNIQVNPWIMPSGTRGGNLDLLVELHDNAGSLLLTNNPAAQTIALIQTNLPIGRYYLHIRNTGVGTPMDPTPTGYTPYASVGQYFLSGSVTPVTALPVLPSISESLPISPSRTRAHQGVSYFVAFVAKALHCLCQVISLALSSDARPLFPCLHPPAQERECCGLRTGRQPPHPNTCHHKSAARSFCSP